MENCDMCGSKIVEQKCECGTWIPSEEMKENPLKKAIEYFHQMRQFTVTGDAPHLGCACVYFRGDYNDCKKVEKFIHQIKGRTFYEN